MIQKNYLVVGGSSGIGYALTKILLETGNQVTVACRRKPELPVVHIPFDATTDALSMEMIPSLLHGIANCPGTINLKPFHRLTDQEFADDFNLNVLGAIKVIRQVLPNLRNAEHASIVLFSTVAVTQGMPFHTSVAASKGAVEGLTRSLAAEYAPKIRVNCIAPSLTDTPLAARLLSSEDKRKSSAERHPLKRLGESQDIAEAAAYLLSSKSSWTTGQILHVDGGMSSIRS